MNYEKFNQLFPVKLNEEKDDDKEEDKKKTKKVNKPSKIELEPELEIDSTNPTNSATFSR